jgi:D-alanyl-lipoteichoic acid acyltransferase DltB (MBOAT superfamily)
MGIRIMDNFKAPYLAKNIAEFWQRWHISLSTWFRDYLYYPMGGNRVKKYRWMINITVVFTVSGIWHGANWTFLIWGGFFGLIYVTEKLINTRFKLEKTYAPYSIGHILLALKTFTLVTILWIFFRSQSFDDAMNIFKYLYMNTDISSALSVPAYVWVFLLLFIVSDIILYNKRFDSWVNNFALAGRWLVYAFLIFSIIVFAGVENFPFIYFQF